MLRLVMPQALTVVVDVVAWGVVPRRHRATPPTASATRRLRRDGWLLRPAALRGRRPVVPAPAADPPLEGPAARRPATSSAAGSASASCRRTTPPGCELFARETRRAELAPLVGDVLRAALRPVEPAARGGAAGRLRRAGQPAVHRDPALQPVPDPGRARCGAPAADRRERRRRVPARPDRPAADRLVAAERRSWSPTRSRSGSTPRSVTGGGRATGWASASTSRARPRPTGASSARSRRCGCRSGSVDGSTHWYDAVAALVYVTHFVSIPLVTGVVWFCLRDRFTAWLTAVLTFTVVGVAGLRRLSGRPALAGLRRRARSAPVDRISTLGLGLPAAGRGRRG